MNLDIIGYVWTGEFDLNTLRVDRKIFESGKKKLRIQKYPDTRGQGLINHIGWKSVEQRITVITRLFGKCGNSFLGRLSS